VWEFLGSITRKIHQDRSRHGPYRRDREKHSRINAGETKAQRGRRRNKWYAFMSFEMGAYLLIFKDSRSSTLFVSNLPYTATSTDLKTLFSDIAPVRNAFIVLEHGTGVSKGVGYVSFAIKEDVQLALDKISSEGLTIDGRGIRAQLAETRHKDKDSASASGNVDQAAKPARVGKSKNPKGAVTTPKDPLAIRTIVLSGLPSSIDAKVLWKKVRKQEGAEKVDWPAKLQTGDEDSTQGVSLYSCLNRTRVSEGWSHSSIRVILRSQNCPGCDQETPRPHLQRLNNLSYPQKTRRQPPKTHRIHFYPRFCLVPLH